MKPFRLYYLIFGTLVCLSLAVANHRGWSLVSSILPRSWHAGAPGSYHK